MNDKAIGRFSYRGRMGMNNISREEEFISMIVCIIAQYYCIFHSIY